MRGRHPRSKTVATSQAPGPQTTDHPAPATTAAGAGTPQFSDRQAVAGTGLPAPRLAPARRRPPQVKIAQRVVPRNLRPVALRDELIELGDLFRAYQQRTEPDLALLADLHERKARAFTTWAEVSGIVSLRLDARRAEQAATAARFQYQQRTGGTGDSDEPAVSRLLTMPTQGDHARSVLAYVADHSPLPGPEARLPVLMLTLHTAHTGTGNLVGQDITALGLTDPEDLVEKLTGCGWLTLPGTADDLLASRGPRTPPRSPSPPWCPTRTRRALSRSARKCGPNSPAGSRRSFRTRSSARPRPPPIPGCSH
ncbi:hypothetical protein GCM10018772_68590 [Streptomyces fumanus]|uniref:Uncharacterized protein n=1 Tax=Streptomyces fumanus TaxID=67302 RepID=A0A919EBG5_9ACTN|nr:hypothetical protein GCM10018772_68590 [Streptomyces fumanus]